MKRWICEVMDPKLHWEYIYIDIRQIKNCKLSIHGFNLTKVNDNAADVLCQHFK